MGEVICFKCNKKIFRQYVLSKKDYSLKNNWEYWTENDADKGEYICNKCLIKLYYKDKGQYLNRVKNIKKRAIFRVYIHNKVIS